MGRAISISAYLLTALLLAGSVVTAADLYQWIDSNRVIHFTDDPYVVPESIRNSEQLLVRRDFLADSEPSNDVPTSVESQTKMDSEVISKPESTSIIYSPQEVTIVVATSNVQVRHVKARPCSAAQRCGFVHDFSRRQPVHGLSSTRAIMSSRNFLSAQR
jgi:hypothetical protein